MSNLTISTAFGLLGLFTIINLYPYVVDHLGVQPYTSVNKVFVETKDNKRTEIGYWFKKNGACDIKGFEVVGFRSNVPEVVGYLDLNKEIAYRLSSGQVELYNRLEGTHFLHISVNATKITHDYLEIRTRHSCAEENKYRKTGKVIVSYKIVSKVFAKIRLR